MSGNGDVRPSPIAGQWYPGSASVLQAAVDRYIDSAEISGIDGEVVAVMAPHAGYDYSGAVAGYAFKALKGLTPDSVIVVSPMHYPYREPLLTSAHLAYQTPLGTIPLNVEALNVLDKRLIQTLGFGLKWVRYDEEHSLEIELPFLQRALQKPFTLIPIMVRDQSLRTARGLGESLGWLIRESEVLKDKEVILVASTDLSHFFPQNSAEKLDNVLLREVSKFDPEGVILVEEEQRGFACGRGALATVMFAAKELGANYAQVLKYATSGDKTGDYHRVVGYGAAVFTAKRSSRIADYE